MLKSLSLLLLLPALLCPALPAQEEDGAGLSMFPEPTGEEEDEEEEEVTALSAPDLSPLLDLIRERAEAGETQAQLALACGYEEGALHLHGITLPFEQNDTAAFAWYGKAAAAGSAEACYRMGKAEQEGRGTAKDITAAIRHWEQALEAGHAQAGLALGMLYFHGRETAEDWEAALRCLQHAAALTQKEEQPDAAILAMLAVFYDKGIGTEPDRTTACRLLEQAAALGHTKAQFMLGRYTEEGLGGLPRNTAKAMELYREAAIAGDREAQCALGTGYAEGKGADKDGARAVIWYRASAAQGCAAALTGLGRCYLNGNGVPRDPDRAEACFRRAAQQGDKEAQQLLRGSARP